jgi:hypothetical protein
VSSIGKLDERFKNYVRIYMNIKMMIKKTINNTLTVRYAVILTVKEVNCEFISIW